MWSNQGSDVKIHHQGQGQLHIISRGQVSWGHGYGYGQSHIWAQRLGTMVFQGAEMGSI